MPELDDTLPHRHEDAMLALVEHLQRCRIQSSDTWPAVTDKLDHRLALLERLVWVLLSKQTDLSPGGGHYMP